MYVNSILGPQGAGKDTQADLLKQENIADVYSVGQILRGVAKYDKYINNILIKGELVPSKKLTYILISFFKKVKLSTKYLVLTGFPRRADQIQVLYELAYYFNWKFGLIIELKIPKKQSILRIKSRYICPKCGRVYNLITNPPKHDLTCDYDGTKLVQRKDDMSIESINERLKIYYTETKEVLHIFENCGCVVKVNGLGTIEQVHQRVIHVFKNFSLYHKHCNCSLSSMKKLQTSL